ncbi:MAG: AraC family transcriptional regulator [Acidimicrobiia bacterium]|nr:AraC family transcriptional regulator [Acidimicrobiia bacterium]
MSRHPSRHLLRAKDLADRHYEQPLTVADMAAAAALSSAHFSREFRKAFGESPHQYLLTRRLERAAALLWNTDWSIAEICHSVGLGSVGSFTTSFGRIHGMTPTEYRRRGPAPEQIVAIPRCVAMAYGRPKSRTFREDGAEPES